MTMEFFTYRENQLYAEDLAVQQLAQEFGTPLYVYSRASLEERYQAYAEPLAGRPHLICYAVKANSNLGVLNVLARLGAGFDIVSAGELERVLAAGGDPARVVFSGVGKQTNEIRRALTVGIKMLQRRIYSRAFAHRSSSRRNGSGSPHFYSGKPRC